MPPSSATRLTSQLLAFSRRQVQQLTVINLNQVTSELEPMLRRLIGEDIEFAAHMAPSLYAAKADVGQIEQVLINLVVNARDAMPQGGKLTIVTKNVKLDKDYIRNQGVSVPAGNYVTLTVSDSGVGMDEATRARVFEPFFTTKAKAAVPAWACRPCTASSPSPVLTYPSTPSLAREARFGCICHAYPTSSKRARQRGPHPQAADEKPSYS